MKLLLWCTLITVNIQGMDKIKHLVHDRDEKKEKEAASSGERHKKDDKEKERVKTPRKEDKHKNEIDLRRASDTPTPKELEARVSKSASPVKGDSPARPATVGKRGSLDWTSVLQETKTRAHMEDSLSKWGGKDPHEESLKKLFQEFPSADNKRKGEIYCAIMRTSRVSATKEAMASNFFEVSYNIAALALYNIPGYYSTNLEEARREIKMFWDALFDAKEAYVNKLCAEAPKRTKWACEQLAMTDTKSPIVQLLAQFQALKIKHAQYSKDFELETFDLPEPKKP